MHPKPLKLHGCRKAAIHADTHARSSTGRLASSLPAAMSRVASAKSPKAAPSCQRPQAVGFRRSLTLRMFSPVSGAPLPACGRSIAPSASASSTSASNRDPDHARVTCQGPPATETNTATRARNSRRAPIALAALSMRRTVAVSVNTLFVSMHSSLRCTTPSRELMQV